jgi:hypothetical protein
MFLRNRGGRVRRLFCVLLLVSMAGCGASGGAPCEVKGSVTLNGERVENGTIVFEPTGQGGARGGATISKGTYQISLDRGMFAGSFTVRISGIRETGETESPFETFEGESDAEIAKVEEFIPHQYNSSSSLQVTLEAGENAEDFGLTGERIDDENEIDSSGLEL